jgi:uncharacterized membrane protein YdjX (TVP38/TMEM64 family)
MKRYLQLSLAMVLVFLGLFGLAAALGIGVLTDDPAPLFAGLSGPLAAAVGVGLLLVDVLLPVPSSVVMVLHGSLFGVVGGTLLSLLGGVGAVAFAFALGRRGGPLLDRLMTPAERTRGDALLKRWGALAVALTRPVPMVAETVALLAGTSPLTWKKAVLAGVLGNLPPALVYAITGALGASTGEGFWVFGGVLIITGAFYFVAQRASRAPADEPA